MTSPKERLSSLEEMVSEQERSLSRKFRTTVIVYAILVMVVAGYTLFVAGAINDLTSVDSLTEQVSSFLSASVPEYRQSAVDEIQSRAPQISEQAVAQTIDSLIPATEKHAQMLLDRLTDRVVRSIETELVAEFGEFIKGDADKLKRDYAELMDKETGEAVVLMFISVIENEMDKYMNDYFIDAVGDLKIRIHDLTKSGAKLTKQEDAQRRAILSWAFLAEHAETGESMYFNLFEQLRQKCEGSFDFVKPEKLVQ